MKHDIVNLRIQDKTIFIVRPFGGSYAVRSSINLRASADGVLFACSPNGIDEIGEVSLENRFENEAQALGSLVECEGKEWRTACRLHGSIVEEDAEQIRTAGESLLDSVLT